MIPEKHIKRIIVNITSNTSTTRAECMRIPLFDLFDFYGVLVEVSEEKNNFVKKNLAGR